MCLGQRLVGFEISSFYQDFQFGSQIGFADKSNAFTTFFHANIIQPMNLPIYFQHLQKYKSFIIKVWNETISKISKVASFQKKTIRNQWFWNTLFYTCKNHLVLQPKFEMTPLQKSIKLFHSNKHYKTTGVGTPFFIDTKHRRFYKQKLKWNHFKNT